MTYKQTLLSTTNCSISIVDRDHPPGLCYWINLLLLYTQSILSTRQVTGFAFIGGLHKKGSILKLF